MGADRPEAIWETAGMSELDGPSGLGRAAVPAAEEARSLALLAEAIHLPGPGWQVVRDRTWVTGELDPDSEKSGRARKAGVVTAWRSFEQDGTGRSAWVEVVPYATAADAELSLRQSPRYFVGTDQADEEVISGGEIEDRSVPGVTNAWIYEKSVRGPSGTRVSRYAAGTLGQVLFITSCSGGEDQWSLDDLVGLATLQADRVSRG
jgi:hypothetical protein